MEVPKQGLGTGWKIAQIAVIAAVLGLGIWQLYRVDFDWRAILDTTSIWTFFLAMSTLPVFGFPISACYIYAGLAFPPLEASIVCLAALALNMSVSYAMTYSVFRTPILRFMERQGWKPPALTDVNQFRLTFLIRTVPGPPFFFQNLTLGLAGIPFWTYLWISLLAQGGIGIGVILCSRYLANDPWSAGGVTVIAVLGALLIAKTIRAIRLRRSRKKESS